MPQAVRAVMDRLGFPALAIVLVLGVAWSLRPVPSSGVLLLLLFVVLISAWQGGHVAGLGAWFLSLAACGWLALGGGQAFLTGGIDGVVFCLFAGVTLLFSWLLGTLALGRKGQGDKSADDADPKRREESMRLLAEAIPQIVWTARPDGHLDSYNQRWYDYTGLTQAESLAPEGWKKVLHPEDVSLSVDRWYEAVRTGRIYEIEYRFRRAADGAYRWHLGRAMPVRDAEGRIIKWFGTCTDIDNQKRGEEALRFLSEASSLLGQSLDYQTRLEHLTHLAVPRLADCCYVHGVEPDGGMRLLAAADVDSARLQLAWQLDEKFPVKPDSPPGLARILRGGQSELWEDISDRFLEKDSFGPEHLAMLLQFGWQSGMAVPLHVQDRIFGTLYFCTTAPGRRLTSADLALAEELARRASVALDNARLYREAQEAAKAKDEFLAMLAHELRNPLTPILNALRLIGIEGLHGPAEEVREIAERQAIHMARLVDDLLDVARITRGQVLLRKEKVDLAVIMQRAADAAQLLIATARHQLHLQLPVGRIRLEADPTRLEQILGNLLHNAVKYTEAGGSLILSAERQGDEAIVRLRDTGMGITPEMLPHIFDLFAQADKSLDRPHGGLGIGLTLVRRLVELHGGSIQAHSEGLNRGSEFIIRLPALPVTLPEIPGLGLPKVTSSLPGRRVLIVDDNADAAHSLALLLRVWGNEVAVAHDGPAALESVKRHHPDVVFLDIGLPGMDGYQVAERMRLLDGVAITLLIAITGYGQEEDRRRSREAGFDQHLVKPVDPETLREILA